MQFVRQSMSVRLLWYLLRHAQHDRVTESASAVQQHAVKAHVAEAEPLSKKRLVCKQCHASTQSANETHSGEKATPKKYSKTDLQVIGSEGNLGEPDIQ